jgi:hypothetical protein
VEARVVHHDAADQTEHVKGGSGDLQGVELSVQCIVVEVAVVD